MIPSLKGKGTVYAALALPFPSFLYFYSRHHSQAYLAAGLSVLAFMLAGYWKWEDLRRMRPGTVLLILFSILLPALGLWQFLQHGDPGDIDQASYTCWFWNMEHGRGYSSFSDFHIFDAHSNYTLVLWLPLHWLAGEFGIKAGKMACILAAVWLAVKGHRGNREDAAWTGVALLSAPSILSQFFFGFQSEFLAAPFIVLAMQAYRDLKLGRFLAYSAFMAYNKEVFTMVVAGILLVAILERRSWKWIMAPALLCCALMGLYWFVISPAFMQGANHFNAVFPKSAGEALALVFRIETAYFMLHLAFPFLPLMWVLPKRYLLVPVPLLLFYAVFSAGTQDSWRHYTYPFPFLCAAGLIMGGRPRGSSESGGNDAAVARGEAEGKAGDSRLSGGRILLACAVSAVLSYPLIRVVLRVPAPDWAKVAAVRQVRAMVPEEASVAVNGSFTAWFAARKEIMAWEFKVKPLESFDFVVLDSAFLPAGGGGRDGLDRDILSLSASPGYTRVFSREGLLVFRRNGYAPDGTEGSP